MGRTPSEFCVFVCSNTNFRELYLVILVDMIRQDFKPNYELMNLMHRTQSPINQSKALSRFPSSLYLRGRGGGAPLLVVGSRDVKAKEDDNLDLSCSLFSDPY